MLGASLGLGRVRANEVYDTLDWLGAGQPAIEDALAQRHLSDGVLMLYDVTRCVDYLAARKEVDPKRIGVVGHSQGGFLVNFVLGLEPRLRVGVASCGYGLFRTDPEQMMLRFVDGRPVSQVTVDYLTWLCAQLAREGKKALLLVWDNASWHISQLVRQWLRTHNPGQAWWWRADRGVPLAEQESVAEPDRAALGAWQACHRGARAGAECAGSRGAGLCVLRL